MNTLHCADLLLNIPDWKNQFTYHTREITHAIPIYPGERHRRGRRNGDDKYMPNAIKEARTKALNIDMISPYIRYVNEIYYDREETFVDRIIYDHEFIFPMSGEAIIFIDHKEYKLTRGTIAYIRPNEQNQMIMEAGKTFHAHCIHFDWLMDNENENFNAETFYMKFNFSPEEKKTISRLIERTNYEITDTQFSSVMCGLNADTLEPLFKSMYYMFISPNYSSAVRSRAAFLSIVAELMEWNREKSFSEINPYYYKLITDTAETLQREYKQSWCITDFSKSAGISNKYFGQLFREINRVSFKEYLNDVRLQNAKRLLIMTDLSVSEIAENVGIHDMYYFSKLFKKKERMSPTHFRQMFR